MNIGKSAVLLLLIGLTAMAGCGRETTSPPSPATPKKTLVIGLIPERNIFRQFERYEPMADYLSRKTGIKITINVLRRYGNIVDNFKSAGMDGAFFGSFTYALAHAKQSVEVLARPVALDNTSTYHGLIFVRKDSRIRNVRDMKGKRFAYVDRATTGGYLFPKEALLGMHLDPEGKRVLERFEARKFIETTNRDYEVVVNYAEAIGLDLATYDYTND
jgi:phosphonate transport system substrate-binding protein